MSKQLTDFLPIVVNSDGSFARSGPPNTPADPRPDSPSLVLSMDIPINPEKSTWVRIFLPKQILLNSSLPEKRLPLLVYYHDGGFILCSAANTHFHNLCSNFATHLGTIVASVEYRLAPEHRLPEAYHDAVEALHWIKSSKDEWLRDFADLSTCFLAGDSAGANIAYHADLRVVAAGDDLGPMKIRGLILH